MGGDGVRAVFGLGASNEIMRLLGFARTFRRRGVDNGPLLLGLLRFTNDVMNS
jgi:hypothetical protein